MRREEDYAESIKKIACKYAYRGNMILENAHIWDDRLGLKDEYMLSELMMWQVRILERSWYRSMNGLDWFLMNLLNLV